MKTKNRTILAAAFVLCGFSLLLTGCATTAGGLAAAGGEQAAGDVYANTKLAKIDGSPAGTAAQKAAVADFTRIGTDLQALTAGTLTPYEQGNIEAQLKLDGLAFSSNTQVVDDINSIVNIFAHAVTSVNGLVLPAQSVAQGTAANIASGINLSVQDYEGQWNVTNPGVWPPPAAKAR